MAQLLLTANQKKRNSNKRRPRRVSKQSKGFRYLANNDLTMQFNTTKDPIYFVFNTLENRSVGQLMNEFVKDSFFEITNFVSKIVK